MRGRVFENLLGQAASGQLTADIKAGLLSPAMLFKGPFASGKGTAALELGRIISCEAPAGRRAAWECSCPACSRHRLLVHPDLLCLGWKFFYTEIAASSRAFLRETVSSSYLLFIRSLRKLLARFNPVLWEDEPKGAKISGLVNSLEEDLDELDFLSKQDGGSFTGNLSHEKKDAIAKLTEGMVKNAFRLEGEGLGENVPIAQLRRAAYWSRHSPSGQGKLLVIENADRLLEEARNSLLKLLEEPPIHLYVVLTTARPGSLPATILSRLRPYRFSPRDDATEKEILRRVFKDEAAIDATENDSKVNNISAYLDSFLPVSISTLEALAAFFASSVAYKAALLSLKRKRPLPDEVVLLGKYCTPKAEAAGLGRPRKEPGAVISLIVEKAANFELKPLFTRFLNCLLELVSQSQRTAAFLPSVSYNEVLRKNSKWAETAVGIYNLRPAQALEKLFNDLSREMADL